MLLDFGRMSKLSGITDEEPVLLTESGEVYQEDLTEMIRKEIQNVLFEMERKNQVSQAEYAMTQQKVSPVLGFGGPGFQQVNSNSIKSRGRTLGFTGIGFK